MGARKSKGLKQERIVQNKPRYGMSNNGNLLRLIRDICGAHRFTLGRIHNSMGATKNVSMGRMKSIQLGGFKHV